MTTLTPSPKPKTVGKALTIRERLESNDFRAAVAQVLPKCLTPERFLRVAILATTKTPKLLQCDQSSFFNALLTLSQYGIEPDGRRAHLIPFENRKRNVTEVQLIIDYKGLAELAMRSGVVSCLHADVVCENDEFEFDAGQLKRHRINFKQPRGPVYAVYALCRFKDGSEKAEVMTVDEIEAVRKRSRAGQNGPWVTDWNEMAKKTVFRRMSKWLPLSPEFRDAVEHDDEPTIDITTTTPAPSNLVATSGFELPESQAEEAEEPTPQPDRNDDGDLGPDKAAPQPERAAKNDHPPTIQDELQAEVAGLGYSLNVFVRAMEDSKSLPNATSFPSYDDIPAADATRLLRSLRGTKSRPVMIQALEQAKAALPKDGETLL